MGSYVPPTLVLLTSASESVQPTPADSCAVTPNQLCRALPPAFQLTHSSVRALSLKAKTSEDGALLGLKSQRVPEELTEE